MNKRGLGRSEPSTYSLRETADVLGVSFATIIVIERQAIGKLVLRLGLATYEELPWRIRKHLSKRKALANICSPKGARNRVTGSAL